VTIRFFQRYYAVTYRDPALLAETGFNAAAPQNVDPEIYWSLAWKKPVISPS
jgi:hypothetical protein